MNPVTAASPPKSALWHDRAKALELQRERMEHIRNRMRRKANRSGGMHDCRTAIEDSGTVILWMINLLG
jgi:hypothetical protein